MLDHGVHHWADSSAKNYLAGALSRPFWVKWEEFGAKYCSSYGSCNRDCRIPAKPEGTGHHAALPTTAMTKSGVVLPNLAMPCSCPSPSQGLILCGVYPEPCTRYCSFPKSTAEPVHGYPQLTRQPPCPYISGFWHPVFDLGGCIPGLSASCSTLGEASTFRASDTLELLPGATPGTAGLPFGGICLPVLLFLSSVP